MSTTQNFQVGDRVRFLLGQRRVGGTIVEDYGEIGVRGRRLFRVIVFMDPDESSYLMPADELETEPEGVTTRNDAIDKESATQYLKNGGLTAILQSNTAGGRNQPRVWLSLDNRGKVTHTFIGDRGVVGGARVPFSALYENRIFSPKKEEILPFLATFGLDREDAEDIIRAIGTAP